MYDDEFLSDLTGLLSAGAIKKTDDDPLDFQVKHFIISGSGVVGSNPSSMSCNYSKSYTFVKMK